MDSRVSQEELEKRRDRDQIAHDNMIAEGGPVINMYDENHQDEGE